MNNRQRFLSTMAYKPSDRTPRFEEGIRDDVRYSWENEGLPPNADLADFFSYDIRQEIEFDLEPRPRLRQWPDSADGLVEFKSRLNAKDKDRDPERIFQRSADWKDRSFPLILRVQRGFFLSMGVEDWSRFNRTIELTKDEPDFVSDVLTSQAELSAKLTDQLLQEITVDAALFSEPIGGNHGPLISPRMYRDLVMPGYHLILDVLKNHGVKIIIVRTYANPRPLIPIFMEAGIHCLWAVEAPPKEMDYLELRREFGKELRLIGGIDTDALLTDRATIRQAVARLEPLVADGGFIPLLDGRVRDEVRYEDYQYYRKLLIELTQGKT